MIGRERERARDGRKGEPMYVESDRINQCTSLIGTAADWIIGTRLSQSNGDNLTEMSECVYRLALSL